MKFYSEKLSPRRLSLQWRLTLLISGLVITACALMYFFISRSAVTGLEGISDYVVLVTPDNSNPISINVDPKILIPDLENQIQNTKNNFLFQSMIATGIIILLSSICTWFVTRRALAPLRRFSDRISQVQAQNLSEPLEVPLSEDEISRLTRSFNDMLARLDNAFSAQKQFVASAAHELRTPLAVMQTNLEVFYKKPEHTPQEYDRLFTMLQEQIGRLSHLAEILLDMTGLQTVERSDTISLAALTEEVFCDLDPVADKHQIRLIQTEGDCTVTGSYILLYRAVYNLVENAIKYNRPSGSVTVSIHSAESAVLEVTDTGIGISPENQEKIFDPFYRVDKSRSRAMGGAGLGLALVSEIARQHNGQVKVTQSSEYRNKDSHQERLQVGCPHNNISYFHCCASKCRSPPCRKCNAYADRDKWSNQNINFGFLRYCFSDFGSEDGYK